MSKWKNNLIKILKLLVESKPGDLTVSPMRAMPDFTEHQVKKNLLKETLDHLTPAGPSFPGLKIGRHSTPSKRL